MSALGYTSAEKTYPFLRYLQFNRYGQAYTIEPDNVLAFGATNPIAILPAQSMVNESAVTIEISVGPDEYSLGSFFSASTNVRRDLLENYPHYVYQSAASTITTVTAGTPWKAAVPYNQNTSYSGVITTGTYYYVIDVSPTAPAFFDYCRTALLTGATEVNLVAQVKSSSASGTIFSAPIPFSMVLPVIYEKSFL